MAELNPLGRSDLPQGPEGGDKGKRILKARMADALSRNKKGLRSGPVREVSRMSALTARIEGPLTEVAFASERIPHATIRKLVRQQGLEALKPLLLPGRLVAQVQHATFGPFHLLEVRTPEEILGLRMPAQVHLVQLLIVGEEDDLGAQLLLGLRREGIVDLLEQGLIVALPALVDDHGREVQVDLVSGLHEVVDRLDAFGDRRSALKASIREA